VDDHWLVVGLGNPGPGYAGNRHNVGQMALAQLADRASATFRNHKANASVAEGRSYPAGPKLVLAKPNSFMNLSGGPVAALLRFFKVEPDHLIVLHDELDIPFDTVRLKRGGGHGGHNGIRDIAAAIGTTDFTRVRLGIGRPPGRQPAADFVLKDFTGQEREALPNMLVDAADAVELIAAEGLEAAQLKYHSPR
jgi:PTH1 family peptidyl-tRNA hydrolase